MDISIEFNFDHLPSDGRKCYVCELPIEGEMIVPWLQVGGPEDVKYFDAVCEKCYKEHWEC
jgi:hypothetical protein